MTGVSELITFKLGVSETSEPSSKPSVSFDKSCTDIQIISEAITGLCLGLLGKRGWGHSGSKQCS